MSVDTEGQVGRRAVLGAAAAAAGWMVVGRVDRAEAASAAPKDFPADLDLHRLVFENWDTTIRTDALWTSTVTSSEQVVRVVAWAAAAGYRVRPRGYGHTWSPLVTESGADEKTIIVDTTRLSTMSMVDETTVRVGAGARMDTLLAYLSRQRRSLLGAPAPGDVTVAGVLAVGGHGTGLPARGEERPAGGTYGTVSNAVVSMTAVVWDEAASTYVVRTFDRSHPDAGALLVNLGRVFVTEVVLSTVPDYSLRSRSTTTIPAALLFADPARAGSQSLTALLDRHGRVGIIWYAFTAFPWVQTWDRAARRPLTSRATRGPYNFPFADNLPSQVVDIVTKVTQGSWHLTPMATETMLAATRTGLVATRGADVWGPAKDVIHFVKPSTLRVSAGSHAVVCRRADVQRVVHDFTSFYTRKLDEYRLRGRYPANNVCEIRITGIDDPGDVGVAGARPATLSGAAPVPGRPELDTVVWLDVLTLPNTPGAADFFAELDGWFRALPASLGVARPEWAKRFAHTSAGPWTDDETMHTWIPRQISGWSEALATFDRLDPKGVFRAPLHDRLMPR